MQMHVMRCLTSRPTAPWYLRLAHGLRHLLGDGMHFLDSSNERILLVTLEMDFVPLIIFHRGGLP